MTARANMSTPTRVLPRRQPVMVSSTSRGEHVVEDASLDRVNIGGPLYTEGVEDGVTSEEGNIVTDKMRHAAAIAARIYPEDDEGLAAFLARVNRELGFAGTDLRGPEFRKLANTPGPDARHDKPSDQ